jgi:hypothetical protein
MSIQYLNDEEWVWENDPELDSYDEYVNRHYYDQCYDNEPDMSDVICPYCWNTECDGSCLDAEENES